MKRFLLFGALIGVLGCVTLPPRHDYSPTTPSGVKCKAACNQMYANCRNEAKQSCQGWSGQQCTDTAPAIKSEMVACINDEKSCLQVCE